MVDQKSFLTNAIALVVVGIGYLVPKYGTFLTTCGYFALSGAITNWIAVHMLFERVPFLYGSGVIPLHFKEFKIGIKHLVMRQFFTETNIKRFFEDDEHQLKVPMEHIIESIDFELIYTRLVETILSSNLGSMLSMVGGEKLITPLKEPLIQKLHIIIQETISSEKFQKAWVKEGVSDEVHQKIEKMVDDRLEELTPQMVKIIIQEMIQKHLGWLVVWGGVFGGLIGIFVEAVNFIRNVL